MFHVSEFDDTEIKRIDTLCNELFELKQRFMQSMLKEQAHKVENSKVFNGG